MKCKHQAWAELVKGGAEPTISYGQRLTHVTAALPRPSQQFPHVIFFMGRDLKDHALAQLCLGASARPPSNHHSVLLRSDERTQGSTHPRLFADCDPTNYHLPPALKSSPACHPQTSFAVDWPPHEACRDVFWSRLLFLFTDVVCIFADDVGGLDVVENLLSTWARIGSSSTLHPQIRPRVMVIVGGRTTSVTQSVIDEQDFLFHLIRPDAPALFDVFADVQTYRIPVSDTHFRQLEKDISGQLHNTKLWRQRKGVTFSATHLNTLFQHSLHHLSGTIMSSFDFVQSSRVENPLDGSFTAHLATFLGLAARTYLPYEGIASYIASAILMDAYPPEMHEFPPDMVFHSLYRSGCDRALRQVFTTEEFVLFMRKTIESELGVFFRSMTKHKLPSYQIHYDNVRQYHNYWPRLQSNSTCLNCLRRYPEHVFSCRHSICDTCVEIFGEPSVEEANVYLCKCMLCNGLKTLYVKLKPRTAAIRVLSIDGGGTRCIMPLDHLVLLQTILGDNLPLCDMFDLGVGTSAGGLIIITLILLRLPPVVCKRIFLELSAKLFEGTLVTKIKRLCTTDSIYGAKRIKQFLQEYCGTEQRLFGYPSTSRSGSKVAITAASIKDSTPFIFTNYNGTAPHRADLGYGRLRPDIEDEPSLWYIAYATAAAPGLIPPLEIPRVGCFHDGGMRGKNNPILIAKSEADHLSYNDTGPDIVLSLGTGSSSINCPPSVSWFRNSWLDGFLPRIYNSFMSSFDGEHTWRDLWGVLDRRAQQKYYRINDTFPDKQPAMDDPASMAGLSKWIHVRARQPQRQLLMRMIVLTLLSSSFYFEFIKPPKYHIGRYTCTGVIRCRSPARAVIRKLVDLQPGRHEFFKDNINLGLTLSENDVCPTCHQYSLPVTFTVRDLKDEFTLSLRFAETSKNLSAFPTTAQSIRDSQGIELVFGHSNHGHVRQMFCDVCDPAVRGRKRKRKFTDI